MTPARELRLREHHTSHAVALQPGETDALLASVPSLDLSPTVGQPGHYDVRPGSTVGVAEVDGLCVSIVPKIPIDRLLFLVSYALDPSAWRQTTASFSDAPSIVEAIAPAFIRQVRTATRRGLLHGYLAEEDALPTIRGRVRFGDQISRRLGDRLPVEVTFDEFSSDIELNRLLRAALHRLRKMTIRSDETRRGLRSLEADLASITLVEYPNNNLPEIVWTRLNRHYRPAVELALLILSSCSIEARLGRRRVSSMLLDMNKVFEDFVLVALREALGLTPSQLVQQGIGAGLTLDDAGRVRLRPDISWWREGRCVFVGDVKYKRIKVADVVHADLYQLHAYITATGVKAGLLIYAHGEAETVEHVVTADGTRLLVRTLAVDGQPDDILAAVADLAAEVEEIAAGLDSLAVPG